MCRTRQSSGIAQVRMSLMTHGKATSLRNRVSVIRRKLIQRCGSSLAADNRSRSLLCFFFSSRRRHTRLQGDWSSDVCSSDLCQGSQLGYRNTTMYSSYSAASFARKHDLAEKHGVNLEGALTWAFEFEGQDRKSVV